MDWYMIEFLYPKAFERFKNVMFPNVGIISISTLFLYDIKKLFQFFDKEGVYLNIEMYNSKSWVFSISLNNGFVLNSCESFKTCREDAEKEGFSECFRILEKKLT